MRHILIEANWRLQQFQPEYKAVKQRRAALDESKARNNKSARKKLGFGLARQFIVDWSRIRTGKTTPAKLGLQMSWPATCVLRGKAPTPSAETKVAA